MNPNTTTELSPKQSDEVIQSLIDHYERATHTDGLTKTLANCQESQTVLLCGLVSTYDPPRRPEYTRRYFLYASPTGEQHVFEVEYCDGDSFDHDVHPVSDGPLYDVRAWYLPESEPLPADLETAGQEITEEHMKEITGYYLDGSNILGEILNQVERVKAGDRCERVIRELHSIARGADPDEW